MKASAQPCVENKQSGLSTLLKSTKSVKAVASARIEPTTVGLVIQRLNHDKISPKLFTATLEDLFRNFDWCSRGVSINGSKLSSLRFADDFTIIAKDLEELEISLNELSVASMPHGLKMNMAKTIVLCNKHVTQRPAIVEGSEIEEEQSYIYLGQRVSIVETDMGNAINRRIQAGWKSFNDHKIVLESNIPNSLK